MAKHMNELEIDLLLELIINLKSLFHELNHWFFLNGKGNSAAEHLLKEIWEQVHYFRSYNHFVTESKVYWDSINQLAMQSFKMIDTLKNDNMRAAIMKQLTQQFMELRQYMEKLEKSAVRLKYFHETGHAASHIGTIPWAAKLSGKSEITIRRHIVSKKIWAMQITKFWWIPKEEILRDIQKGEK